VFLNNRYHVPTTGTFISVDPLVSMTGEPYLYANGNPTTLSDPSGLDPGWAHDDDPCNDAGYYDCTSAGPTLTGAPMAGPRQVSELLRGIGINRPPGPLGTPAGCTASSTHYWDFGGGACWGINEARPEAGVEYSSSQIPGVVQYLTNGAGNALGGASSGFTQTVAVLRGKGKGKYVVFVTEYSDGLGDLANVLPSDVGTFEVVTRNAGHVFMVLDVGFTAIGALGDVKQVDNTMYKIGYVAAETAAIVGAAAAGSAWGGRVGMEACGPWCALGLGTAGGFVGAFFADHATDFIVQVVG